MIDSPGSVVVTGGGRGIGAAIAARFAKEGYGVLACGRGARPDQLGAGIDWARADVSKEGDVKELFAQAMRSFGLVSVLVNNAGIQTTKKITESTDADWTEVIGTNALGVFRCSRAAIPLMIKSGGGLIINIGSISGFQADPGMALYNASKALIRGLTRSISVDHGAEGIRCNAICPGWIEQVWRETRSQPLRTLRPRVATRSRVIRWGALARRRMWHRLLFGSPPRRQLSFPVRLSLRMAGLLAASPIQPHLF